MKKLSIWIPVPPYAQQRPRSTIIYPAGMKKKIEALPGIEKFLSQIVTYFRPIEREAIKNDTVEIKLSDLSTLIQRASDNFTAIHYSGPPSKTKMPWTNVYDPKESEEYKKALKAAYVKLIKSKFPDGSWEPLRGALAIGIDFFFERPKSVTRKYPIVKPDLDNLIKPALDAGNGILWLDDSIFVRYDYIEKHYAGADGPGVKIVARPYGQDEFVAKQQTMSFVK